MKIIKIFLSVCLILTLTACNVNRQNAKVKEIEFWTLQLESFRPYITEVISEFEKTHPDIKIKWVDIPFSEGEKRTLASVMSNNTPDLVNLNPDFSATLATRHALINIDDYVPEEALLGYLPTTIENLTYQEHIFGIPWYLTTSVTYYNKKLTGNLSLPKDYFDLLKFSAELKKQNGSYALMPTVCESGNILKIMNKYNAIDYSGEKLTFNNETSEKLLNLFKELYQKDYIPKESVTQTHREALEQFMSGQTALLVSGTNFLNTIKDNAPEVYKNLDVYEQLSNETGKFDFSMMNLIIPLKSKHPKEAVMFALYLTNADNQLKFAKLAPVFPSQSDALGDSYFLKTPTNIDEKVRYIGAKGLQNAIKPIVIQKNHSMLNEIVDSMTQKILLNKETTKSALDNAQNEWNNLK